MVDKDDLAKKVMPEKKKRIATKYILIFILSFIIIVAASVGGYFYFNSKLAMANADDKEVFTGKMKEDLLVKIGRLVVLPKGEEPTIATVSDKSKLLEQAFFRQAENGDKLLLYEKTKKAILYRPSINRVVDITVVINDQSSSDVAGAATQASGSALASGSGSLQSVVPFLTILNGTKISGLAGKAQTLLQSKITGLAIKSKGNAQNEYQETLVVDVTGKNRSKAEEVAKVFGGSVVSLPSGEETSQADILILLGGDQSSKL